MGLSGSMFTGVTGLLNNAEAISVVGNNIANTNTVGFKYDRTIFSDMLYQRMSPTATVGKGVSISAVETQFNQGAFEATENVTDLAIQGDALFQVQDDAGSYYYTKAGDFHLDENGEFLVNSDGYMLCDATGNAIDITTATDFAEITAIGSDGTITYLKTDGTYADLAAKVGLYTFTNELGLDKTSGTLFKETTTSGTATAVTSFSENQIASNYLEASNVDMASQFVKLIQFQRGYSANSKTITTADEMTQEVLNLKR